ncbi:MULTISPECIES: hypothetical protein [unclassified Streptomyces]|uniref:hypothetical protein n=1 Tax=unclassified Streptomyces TaxID=2593676 RepID=UPI001661CA6A|nr:MULTISPECIES: hypothetical protein [unclassified Streptomyces]MBD0843692.1 hypothetical protein [Streptomyces sp. TRM68416]
MRRTVRALSAAALAGAALGAAAPSASADPAAEVSPATAHPGGSVTVSVTCAPLGGPAPATMDATSQAFEEGTVALQKVPGGDEQATGPAYRGTARIVLAEEPDGGLGPDSAWTVDGTCPAAPGGRGKPWSATFTVIRGSATARPCTEPHRDSCSGAAVQRGVRAGQGGAFTDSVPALVTGGVLIAGALGGAAYRLRRKAPAADA